MFLNENKSEAALPLYEVQELSMDEALLVLMAEKELLECRQAVFARHTQLNVTKQSASTLVRNKSH